MNPITCHDDDVWIFGCGAHGDVVAETLFEMGVGVSGRIDDHHPQALRPEAVLAQTSSHDRNVVVAIGSPPVRARVTERLLAMGFLLAPPIVHPSSYVAPSVTLGPGTVILPQAFVHTHASIGTGVLINACAAVHHDAIIGDFTTISPHAHVCGRCVVGKGSLLAVRSCLVFPHRMGDNAILAANSVAHKDIGDGELWRGDPAAPRRTVDEALWRKCFP